MPYIRIRDKEKDRLRTADYRKRNPEKAFKAAIAACQNNPEAYLWRSAKKRAETLGIEFAITKHDIKIPACCPVLGVPLGKVRNSNRRYSPSIDRIDPKKGYTPDNIQIISNQANTMKSDSSIEELTAFVTYWGNQLRVGLLASPHSNTKDGAKNN